MILYAEVLGTKWYFSLLQIECTLYVWTSRNIRLRLLNQLKISVHFCCCCFCSYYTYYSYCECLTNLRWQLLHVSFLFLLHSNRAMVACAMHIECWIEFADISLKCDGKRNFYDCSSYWSVDVNFYFYNLVLFSQHFPQFQL